MPATITGGQNGTVGLINTLTAQNSTAGTSIDFTGIPSGVRRVTVMFNGVSTNGTSQIQVQLGSTTIQTTGYQASSGYGTAAGTFSNASTGFILDPTGTATAAALRHGMLQISLLSANTWVQSGGNYNTVALTTTNTAGSVTLPGTLDRVRITTVNGTDTFDAGSINVLYE